MTFADSALQRLTKIVQETYPSVEQKKNKTGGVDFSYENVYLCGIRAGVKDITLYLMPLYSHKEIELEFSAKVGPWRSGKSCLKFNERKPMNWEVIREVLTRHRELIGVMKK